MNEESIMFISGDIDQGMRSCFVCGQPITNLRKARELGDSTVLVHAGACEKALTDAPVAGPKPVLCPLCTHTVGSDAVQRRVGSMTASFHPRCAQAFDAQVKNMASEMITRQAPKPVESKQTVKKTLAKSAQADEYITVGLDVLERTFGVRQTSQWWINGDIKLAE